MIPADPIRALIAKWRKEADAGDVFEKCLYRDCANELEAVLAAGGRPPISPDVSAQLHAKADEWQQLAEQALGGDASLWVGASQALETAALLRTAAASPASPPRAK